jgi:predicted transposase YbfD/YdcC
MGRDNVIIGNEANYIEDIRTIEPYNGYKFKVSDVLKVTILAALAGMKNIMMTCEWAHSGQTPYYLAAHYGIMEVPQKSQFYGILRLIDPQWLSENFTKWVADFIGATTGLTLAVDGKSIRSTGKMENFENPLHIVTAYVSELGMSLGQLAVDGKTNEIPTAQSLIKSLSIKGMIVVADALNCQKETAKLVLEKEADYLLSVKGNQKVLFQDLEDYFQDSSIRNKLQNVTNLGKVGGRVETHTAWVSNDVEWLNDLTWQGLKCVGMIRRIAEFKGKKTEEFHYYISSKDMTPQELLKHARAEWGVESMHWLLDVHYSEDQSLSNNEVLLRNMNIIHKIALNILHHYKTSRALKASLASLMRASLFDFQHLLNVTKSLKSE